MNTLFRVVWEMRGFFPGRALHTKDLFRSSILMVATLVTITTQQARSIIFTVDANRPENPLNPLKFSQEFLFRHNMIGNTHARTNTKLILSLVLLMRLSYNSTCRRLRRELPKSYFTDIHNWKPISDHCFYLCNSLSQALPMANISVRLSFSTCSLVHEASLVQGPLQSFRYRKMIHAEFSCS